MVGQLASSESSGVSGPEGVSQLLVHLAQAMQMTISQVCDVAGAVQGGTHMQLLPWTFALQLQGVFLQSLFVSCVGAAALL